MVRFYTSAILGLYCGLSLYLRSSALCQVGSNTSRRDACLGCDANYVNLPATTRSVWIQRTYHQPPLGCRLIFQKSSSTTFPTRHHHCEKRRYCMDSPTSTASTSTSSSAPITSTSPDDAILTCNSGLVDQPNDSYIAHLPHRLFLYKAMRSMTEQEAVVKSVEERQSSSSLSPSSATLMWPSIGGMPINEFTTEGYFICAFPTLFPTGAADFSGR